MIVEKPDNSRLWALVIINILGLIPFIFLLAIRWPFLWIFLGISMFFILLLILTKAEALAIFAHLPLLLAILFDVIAILLMSSSFASWQLWLSLVISIIVEITLVVIFLSAD